MDAGGLWQLAKGRMGEITEKNGGAVGSVGQGLLQTALKFVEEFCSFFPGTGEFLLLLKP